MIIFRLCRLSEGFTDYGMYSQSVRHAGLCTCALRSELTMMFQVHLHDGEDEAFITTYVYTLGPRRIRTHLLRSILHVEGYGIHAT